MYHKEHFYFPPNCFPYHFLTNLFVFINSQIILFIYPVLTSVLFTALLVMTFVHFYDGSISILYFFFEPSVYFTSVNIFKGIFSKLLHVWLIGIFASWNFSIYFIILMLNCCIFLLNVFHWSFIYLFFIYFFSCTASRLIPFWLLLFE